MLLLTRAIDILSNYAASPDTEMKICSWSEDILLEDLLTWLTNEVESYQAKEVNWTSLLDRPSASSFTACSQGRPPSLPNWIKYTWCLPLLWPAPPDMKGGRRAAALKLLFSSGPWTALGAPLQLVDWCWMKRLRHHHCSTPIVTGFLLRLKASVQVWGKIETT